MDRCKFIESTKCQKDLNKFFDEIMLMYDISDIYKIDKLNYNVDSGRINFNLFLPSINNAKLLKNFINNKKMSNFNNRYNINAIQNKNILNITLINTTSE